MPWNPQTSVYLVYNANGGTFPDNTPHHSVQYDLEPYGTWMQVVVPIDFTSPNIPTLSGKIFLGWSANASATLPNYEQYDGRSITLKDDVVLYAVWGNVPSGTGYIYYDGNGGNCTIPLYNFNLAATDQYGNPLTRRVYQEPEPTWASHEFLGWAYDRNATTPNFTWNSVVSHVTLDQNYTFYAVWTEYYPRATITYNGNGGTCNVVDSMPARFPGEEFILNYIPTPTKEGKVFLGWGQHVNTPIPQWPVGTETAIMPNSSVGQTLYAIWGDAPVYHTVTYKDTYSNGPFPETKEYLEYSWVDIEFSPKPIRTHYIFKGWLNGIDAEYHYESDGPQQLYVWTNINMYPIWEEEPKYSVTYNGNGGSTIISDSAQYYVNDNVDVIFTPTPTKEHYTFLGWSEYSNVIFPTYTSGGATTFAMPNKHVNLYAIWQENSKCRVYYDGNGGSSNVSDDTSYYAGEDTVTVKFSPTPTKSGYKFLGWSTNADATTPTYTVMGLKTFTIGITNVRLYAVWQETLNVTYDGNGGTSTIIDTTEYVENDTVTVLFSPLPSKTGYKFVGWSTNPNATSPMYVYSVSQPDPTFTIGSTSVILYAVWKFTYRVYYDGNGGNSTIEDNIEYVESTTVFVQFNPNPTKSQNIFLGWSTNPNATIATYAPNGLTRFDMGTSDVTLYAIFQPICLVHYSGNTGTTTITDDRIYLLNETVTVIFDPTPTKEDHTFMGWSTNAKSTVPLYTSTGVTEFVATLPDVTLYAVWLPEPHSVIYNGNGGTCTIVDDNDHYPNTLVSIRFTPTPEKTGHTFLGWSVDSTAVRPQYTSNNISKFIIGYEDVTLYAIWSDDSLHYVIYNANGGKGTVPIDDNNYAENDTVTVQFYPKPYRYGYTLLGYDINPYTTTPTYTETENTFSMGTQNVTLYAIWEESPRPTISKSRTHLPLYLRNVRELQGVCWGYDVECGRLFENLRKESLNIFVDTMDEYSISRWEKIFNIANRGSLDDRRYNLKYRLFNRLPFTKLKLEEWLNNMVDEDYYTLTIDGLNVYLAINLESEEKIASIATILRYMVPANILLNVNVKENTFEMLHKYTYGQLKPYTYGKLKTTL